MASETVSEDRIERAVDRLEDWFANADCPGMSVTIASGDDVVIERGFGHRALDPEAPATAETVYGVGSVAKPVTALATLLLDERGHIDLDDPVSAFVPYFEDVPGEPITVHELLSHTSGMPGDGIGYRTDLDSWEAFREFLDGTTDRRKTDRDRFIYYNSGYTVLARLVTAVTETPFPAFVEREIFDPLGMERSTFDSAILDGEEADVMTPYVTESEGVREATVADNPVMSRLLQGPGGLFTSVTDLARFLQANLRDDPRLDVSLERLRTPVVTTERFVDGTEHFYGYGWELEPFEDDTLVYHSGNTGVSGGFVGFLERHGLGMAVGCNAMTEDPHGIARELLAVLTGRDSYAPEQAVARSVADLAGRYEAAGGVNQATVRRNEAYLEIEFEGGDEQFEVRVLPTDLARHCCQFTDVDRVESTTDVEFFPHGDRVEFLFEGLLFRRTERADSS